MQVWRWDGFFDYLLNRYLLEGAAISVALTLAAMDCGLAIGVGIAAMRLAGGRLLPGIAAFYRWIIRGTPLLVQLLLIYTGLPLLGAKFGVWEAALLGLSLNEGAYLNETVRAGTLAVPRGRREVALALALRPAQAFRLVTWPQAFRVIIPPLGNSVNGLLKTTSICAAISLEELPRRAQILIPERFLVLELFAVAALYYLLLISARDLVQRRLERRYGRGWGAAAAADQG